MNDAMSSKKLSKTSNFSKSNKKLSAAYQIKFGSKTTKKMRLDNASSPNQRKLIHSRKFFLMTNYDWKGASKNYVT